MSLHDRGIPICSSADCAQSPWNAVIAIFRSWKSLLPGKPALPLKGIILSFLVSVQNVLEIFLMLSLNKMSGIRRSINVLLSYHRFPSFLCYVRWLLNVFSATVSLKIYNALLAFPDS